MVRAHCPGAVAIQCIQRYQPAIRFLVKGIVVQQSLRVLDGGRVGALALQQADHAFQGSGKFVLESLALGQDPIVVATGQQVSMV